MTDQTLSTTFSDRAALRAHVMSLSPSCGQAGDHPRPDIAAGGRAAAEAALATMDPRAYAASRNHLDGAVTRLSPISGMAFSAWMKCGTRRWRLSMIPKRRRNSFRSLPGAIIGSGCIWRIPSGSGLMSRPTKQALTPANMTLNYPMTSPLARTGVARIDQFIATLLETGYLHNHARMYLASYTVHWRRVSWQAGARWFLEHLVDADPASNNLSWQWIASTFSNKPYIFNLENVAKYSGPDINVIPKHNLVLAQSYERLSDLLFPHMGGPHG